MRSWNITAAQASPSLSCVFFFWCVCVATLKLGMMKTSTLAHSDQEQYDLSLSKKGLAVVPIHDLLTGQVNKLEEPRA